MAQVVISLFDKTTNLVKPWRDAGYVCICIDIQHKEYALEEGIIKLGRDIMTWDYREFFRSILSHGSIIFTAAFPPCTDLAVSGARWFRKKESDSPGTRERAMAMVYRAHEICEHLHGPYFIENPVSVIASEWRKPDYSFNPCDYGGYLDPIGDQYTKKTCLWTGNGFRMPEPRPVEPIEGSKMHLMPPGPNRGDLRSATPMGFAIANFLANRPV